jgi:Asp-tRNA(Asn)/Glu-tRNA(Gln) amidotransferase B subunit
VLGRNEKLVDGIKNRGEMGKVNALIGQVMGVTKGQAKPDLVRKLILDELGLQE